MTGRRAAIVTAGAVITATAVGGGTAAPPAAAQQEPYQVDVAGNFAGNPAEEVFSYVSGAGADRLLAYGNGGTPGGELTIQEYGFTVSGAYWPVAGDFDGDPHDEILFYAPGAAQDHLWDFNGWRNHRSTPMTVGGDYWPAVGDFTGDGTEDIFFYGAGSIPDYLWDFGPNGRYTSHAFTVSGTYEPVSGSFGADATDDLLFYARGAAADYLWDFVPGGPSITSRPLPVGGDFWPVPLDIYAQGWGGGDIVWYGRGTARDYLWDFQGGALRSSELAVNGVYAPVAGDFFGDGHDDVLWLDYADVGFNLWDHAPDGAGGVALHTYDRSEVVAAPSAAAVLSAADGGTAADGRAPTRRAPG